MPPSPVSDSTDSSRAASLPSWSEFGPSWSDVRVKWPLLKASTCGSDSGFVHAGVIPPMSPLCRDGSLGARDVSGNAGIFHHQVCVTLAE